MRTKGIPHLGFQRRDREGGRAGVCILRAGGWGAGADAACVTGDGPALLLTAC